MFFFAKSDSVLSSVPPSTVPVVILLVSIVALTIIIERMVFFWNAKALSSENIQKLKEALREKKWEEASDVLKKASTSAASLVLQVGIEQKRRNSSYILEDMETEGFKQVQLMDRFLSGLSTIATISPLLGVLGTVLGIIRSFAEGAGTKGAEVGISEALITTAMGLAVAIPSYIFVNYFNRVKDDRLNELENLTNQLSPYLTGEKK